MYTCWSWVYLCGGVVFLELDLNHNNFCWCWPRGPLLVWLLQRSESRSNRFHLEFWTNLKLWALPGSRIEQLEFGGTSLYAGDCIYLPFNSSYKWQQRHIRVMFLTGLEWPTKTWTCWGVMHKSLLRMELIRVDFSWGIWRAEGNFILINIRILQECPSLLLWTDKINPQLWIDSPSISSWVTQCM